MQALILTRHGVEAGGLVWSSATDEPTPGPGQVLIRVAAVAVNWADILERAGRYPGAPEPPYVVGHDMAGTVIALGAGVTGRRVGERVFGVVPTGAVCAQLAVVDERLVYPTPDGFTDVEAAGAAGPYLTADAALFTMGGLQAGQSVLVQAGAGAFGSACIQLAAHHGAELIVATAGGAAKVAATRELGAHVGIDYTSEDFVPRIQELTDGAGVDLVLDSVGGDVLDRSLTCVRPGGRLVTVGSTSGHGSRALRLHMFFELGILVGGFTLGTWLREKPELVAPSVTRVLEAFRAGVRPRVDEVFPPTEAEAAYAHLAGRQSVGRTVIELSHD